MSITPPKSYSELAAAAAAEAAAAPSQAEIASREPYHVAAVIDGEVVQMFHTEERFAAVLLSSPTFVQCAAPLDGGPETGWKYDASTGTFTK
jgi:hypothetical protein